MTLHQVELDQPEVDNLNTINHINNNVSNIASNINNPTSVNIVNNEEGDATNKANNGRANIRNQQQNLTIELKLINPQKQLAGLKLENEKPTGIYPKKNKTIVPLK
jgi:hypothetical protein